MPASSPRITSSRKIASKDARHFSSHTQQPQNAPAAAARGEAEANPDEPELSSHLRSLMRGMPHSVVVATATSPSPEAGRPPQYRGMTVSSFTTLTLTPIPIITFNIRKPSTTLDAIRASGAFHVHILSATESAVRVADAFTKGNGAHVFRSQDFTVLRRSATAVEPPLLAASGITRVLRCEVLEEPKGLLDVGDHVLVLGRVLGILVPPTNEEGDGALCYADREYRRLGEVIDKGKDG
ncbi:MAG: hypothetical protein M1818_003561 [Claussenomyces sp. TS43310]|nr:MAG: hypothetical protein M1818_003561 [Claussenomyces sp. TS43310]